MAKTERNSSGSVPGGSKGKHGHSPAEKAELHVNVGACNQTFAMKENSKSTLFPALHLKTRSEQLTPSCSTMYSTFQRAQNVTSYAVSMVLGLLVVLSLWSWWTIPIVEEGTIGLKQFLVVPGTGFQAKDEFALIRFDVQADLKPLFDNYNTKQLYVSLTADYNNTKEGTTNSFVLWDRLITRQRPSDAVLSIEGARPKYLWKAPKGSFKDIPTTQLTLRYDLMPYVGLLSSGITGRARNPAYRGSETNASYGGARAGEWDLEVPKVRSGGI